MARDLGAGLGERTEQPFDLGRLEADAAVVHRDNEPRESASGRRGARLEPHGAALGELDGVVDQVLESRAQPHRVADEQVGQVVGNVRFRREAFRLRARRQRIRQKFDEPPRPENFFAQRQRAGFRLGRIEDQSRQRGEMLGARFDAGSPAPLALAESGTRQQLAERQDAGKRGADVVRECGECRFVGASGAARRDERRRAGFATDFAFDLERAMAPPRRRGQHATAFAGTKQAQGIISSSISLSVQAPPSA